MNSPSERERVFASLAASLSRDQERTPLPGYDDAICVSTRRLPGPTLWDNFAANFQAVHGIPLRSVAELAAFLRDGGHRTGFCDPALHEEIGSTLERDGLAVFYTFERARIDSYAFGITRASGAIAESGTLILNDHDTCDRLAALAPWVHVAVLREPQLIRTIPEALARLGASPNVVWVTGPSKTGDIEGILIEGVHGPGVQICLCLP